MSEELRLYSFQNMYLPGVHCGPQGIHSVVEMGREFNNHSGCRGHMYRDWADNYKTVIMLNGGNHRDLEELVKLLCEDEIAFSYPWSAFNEDIDSLNGAKTNVCIVLPKRIFDPQGYANIKTTADVSTMRHVFISSVEFELSKRISECRLMN